MERSSQGLVFVGIDVAKDRLEVHLRPAAEAFAVGRDDPGLAVLAERLSVIGPSLMVLEATGGFEIEVAAAVAAGAPSAEKWAGVKDLTPCGRAATHSAYDDRPVSQELEPCRRRPCDSDNPKD